MKLISNKKPFILYGSQFEQGYQYGVAAKQDIVGNVEAVEREHDALFSAGIASHDYWDVVKRSVDYIHAVDRQSFDEIAGVAAGAALPLEVAADLTMQPFFALRRVAAECSQFFFARPVGRYLLKTRDISTPRLIQHVVVRHYPGVVTAEIVHAGALTTPGSGLSSRGIAISTSGVWSRSIRYPLEEVGHGWNLLNPHPLLRDATSARDVVEGVARTRRLTSMNVITADLDEAFTCETTMDRCAVHRVCAERAVLTNHFRARELQVLNPNVDEYCSTFVRSNALEAIPYDAVGGARDLLRAVCEHPGPVADAVCRHARDETGTRTVYLTVADLRENTLYAVVGQPCTAIHDALHDFTVSTSEGN
jgi:hypothetical protein